MPQPPGQSDEAVRELGHRRLALVHRLDDAQVVQPAVADLLLDEVPRDHPGDVAAGRERGVGDRPHQADRAAAVDEAEAAADERGRQVARGGA